MKIALSVFICLCPLRHKYWGWYKEKSLDKNTEFMQDCPFSRLFYVCLNQLQSAMILNVVFFFLILLYFTLQYCIGFAIHQHESSMLFFKIFFHSQHTTAVPCPEWTQ